METPEGEGNIPQEAGTGQRGRCRFGEDVTNFIFVSGASCPVAQICSRSPALSRQCHPSLSLISIPIPNLPPGAGSCLETDDVLGSNSKVY